MSAAPPARPLDAGVADLSLWHYARRSFGVAWAVLALLFMPLCVLQQIDALRVFASPLEIARDLALLIMLCALPAAALVGLSLAVHGLAHLLKRAQPQRWAWAVVLIPVLWLFVWQLARISWLWLKLVSGHQALVSPNIRYAAMVGIVIAMAWLGRRVGRRHGLLDRLLARLDGLHWPLRALVLTSVALLLISPPRRAQELAAPTARAADSRPDVVIISLDALAAQDAAICGDGPTPMPQLRALAAESICYTRMYAASNFTTPTTSTLETGALPWSHFATQISAKIDTSLRQHTLAQALRDSGYRTLTTTDNQLASPRHHGSDGGYMQHAITPSALTRDKLRAALTLWPESSLPLLADSALSFLGAFDTLIQGERNPFDSQRVLGQVPGMLEAQQPSLVWVHSMPPHSPYLPPASTKYKLLPAGQLERWADFMDENIPYSSAQQGRVDQHRLRYRESIMATDAALGELITQLRRSGRLDKALLLVTVDHGESFEKGFLGHAGPALHEALIRIPLLVRLPGQRAGRIVDTPVSQADLAPSILDYVGAAPLPHAEGRSLASSWRSGEAPATQPVYAMAMERQSRFQPLTQGHFALIEPRFKLVLHMPGGSVELFDLRVDPDESNNLSKALPAETARMKTQLLQQLQSAEARRSSRAAAKP